MEKSSSSLVPVMASGEVTLELLRRGARVAAVDINQAALDETLQLAGANSTRVSTHIVNVADLAQVAALPAAVIAAVDKSMA
jgi:NAD(P)-dependent dehydrogenase (short-subunit alcohol dehydrogenase family)